MSARGWVRVAGALAIGAAAALLVPSAALADVDDFFYERVHVDYTLSRDADSGGSRLEVAETMVTVFPEHDQNRGIRRGIPESFNDAPLWPRLLSITDENGLPRPQETETNDDTGEFLMTSRAATYLHGPQTYTFHYLLENVTEEQADGTIDFYWNLTPPHRRQPIDDFSMTLTIDPELVPHLTGAAACYTGPVGSTERCEIARDGATFEVTIPDLGMDNVTIAVGFAQGTFTPFDASVGASPVAIAQLVALVPAAAAVGWAAHRRRRYLQDDPGRPVIIAEYDPPPGVSPMEAAVFLQRPQKALAAGVVNEAIRGSLRLVEHPGRRKPVLAAELVDRAATDGDGRMLLRAMFGSTAEPGATFMFDGKPTPAAKRMGTLIEKLPKGVHAAYRRSVPRGTRALPATVAILTGVLVVVLGIVAMSLWVDPLVPVLTLIAAVLLSVTALVILGKQPLNPAGAELRDHLAGLREFIEWAEADRLRMLQSAPGAERTPIDPRDPRQLIELYERLLPYAIVFGQEQSWAQLLQHIYTETGTSSPGWYSSPHTFSAAALSGGISSIAVASVSSGASGSSASSGGGSSGGGGGGGSSGGV